ncbi:hypothetical protein V1511DRAFT_8595 [Dipodascopsis uninucleata]
MFDMGILLGDPFALATLSVAMIGWVIAIGASIARRVAGYYPAFSWWGIAYEFMLICGVVYVMGSNSIEPYRVAVVGFAAAALIYTTNTTNNLIYTGRASDAAAAAGHILLSIINILWIFYFGTTPDAAPHAFIDSYALHRDARAYESQRKYTPQPGAMSSHGRHGEINPSNVAYMQPQFYRTEDGSAVRADSIRPQQQMFTSAQLNGFETTSIQASSIAATASNTLMSGSVVHEEPNGTMLEPLDAPTEYPLRARAIYSYDANPEDANELSFVKGEILEVSDVSGRWWQARRANGEVGICPSNYVQLES